MVGYSFGIHLRATRAIFAPEMIVIVAEKNELNHLIMPYYLTVLVYTETTIHPSVDGQRWIITWPLCGTVNNNYYQPPFG